MASGRAPHDLAGAGVGRQWHPRPQYHHALPVPRAFLQLPRQQWPDGAGVGALRRLILDEIGWQAYFSPRPLCIHHAVNQMAQLPILVAPDPRLKVKCKPVGKVDDATRRLMEDMLETMYAAPGIGLAAPQVGVISR